MRQVAVVAGFLVLATTAVYAEPPGATPPVLTAPTAPPVESYRGQVLVVDGLAAALTIAAFSDAKTIAPLAIGMYVGGAPLMHLIHHRPSRALGDLVLRCVPFGVGVLILSSNHDPDNWNILLPTAVGLFGTALAVSALDAALLAKGDEPPPPPRSWTPVVAPARGGAMLGVGGSF